MAKPTTSTDAAQTQPETSPETAPAAPVVPAWVGVTRDLIRELGPALTHDLEFTLLNQEGAAQEAGQMVALSAPTSAQARSVAAHLLYPPPGETSPTGMAWAYAGDGPDLERHRFAVYLRVTPLAPVAPAAPAIPL